MTALAPAPPAFRPLPSVAEYLAREDGADVRHEYVAGHVYAMSGGTRAHNRIALNVAAHLLAALGQGGCRVSVADVKVRVTPEVFYYPDVMVACGPAPEDPHVEDAPCLLVEVLSPSTRHLDRGEKADLYRTIPSLRLYAIVHQDRRRAELYARTAEGGWAVADVIGNGLIEFPCPAGAPPLTLDGVYRGAEPPAEPAAADEGPA